jgi:hypothetical protein
MIFMFREVMRKNAETMRMDRTINTIGFVTPPKIGGRKKSLTPGGANVSPSASSLPTCGLLPVLPAGVHSAGGIVTIRT